MNWCSVDTLKNIDVLCQELKNNIFGYIHIDTRIDMLIDKLKNKNMNHIGSIFKKYYSLSDIYNMRKYMKDYIFKDKDKTVSETLNNYFNLLPSINYFDGIQERSINDPYFDIITILLGISREQFSNRKCIFDETIIDKIPNVNGIAYMYQPGDELYYQTKPILTKEVFESLPDNNYIKRKHSKSWKLYSRRAFERIFYINQGGTYLLDNRTLAPDNVPGNPISVLYLLMRSKSYVSNFDNIIKSKLLHIYINFVTTSKFKKSSKKYVKQVQKEKEERRKRLERSRQYREMYLMSNEERYMKKIIKVEKRIAVNERKRIRIFKKNEEMNAKMELNLMRGFDIPMTKAAILKRKREKIHKNKDIK